MFAYDPASGTGAAGGYSGPVAAPPMGATGDVFLPSLGSAMGGTSGGGTGAGSAGAMGSVDSMGRSRRVMGGPSSTTTYLLANPGAAAGTGFHGGPGGGYVTGAGADEIRTIFVTGFPPDIRDREFHNLVCFLPGYEASQMSQKGGQPQGFALFASAAHAMQAVDALVGLPFDVVTGQPSMAGSAGTTTPGGGGQNAVNPGGSILAAASNASAGGAAGGAPANATPAPIGSGPPSTGSSSHASEEGNTAASAAGGTTAVIHGPMSPTASAAHQAGQQPPASLHTLMSAGNSVGSGDHNQRLSQRISAPEAGACLGKTYSGAASLSSAPVGTVYKLRAEMAHKNMYIKDNDVTIRRAHRALILLPNPGAYAGPSAALAGLGHVGVASAASRLGPQAVDPITGARIGLGNGGNAGSGGLHPLAAAAAGLPGQVNTNSGATTTTTVLTGSTATIPALGPVGFLPVANRNDNPPCNTLFIGNLSDQVSEVELMALFSVQAGFKQMKLVRGPKQVSCFVEFEDVVSAASVHSAYQGAVLPSSDRGGIRIQFSKNPFGRRTSTTGGLGPGGGMSFVAGPGAGGGLESLAPGYAGVGGWQQGGSQLQSSGGQVTSAGAQGGQNQGLYGGLAVQQVQLQPMQALYY